VRLLVRTTAGGAIGLGHLRRCLSLASALLAERAEVVFAIDGDLVGAALTRADGFVAYELTTGSATETLLVASQCNADAVIADSYEFDARYFRELRASGALLVALDDCIDRELPVEMVVNPTVGVAPEEYEKWTSARLLLGPRYALLRKAFSSLRARQIRQTVETLLVSIGGSDPHHLTPRVVEWACQVFPARVDVIIGPMAAAPRNEFSDRRVVLHCNPPHMHELMLAADLAVSAGGQTTYELAATGTPTVAIRTAANQTRSLQGLQSAGALHWIGDASDEQLEATLKSTLSRLLNDQVRREAMSVAGQAIVDGHGAERVAREIVMLRAATR